MASYPLPAELRPDPAVRSPPRRPPPQCSPATLRFNALILGGSKGFWGGGSRKKKGARSPSRAPVVSVEGTGYLSVYSFLILPQVVSDTGVDARTPHASFQSPGGI